MPCFDECTPSKRMVWGVFVGRILTNAPHFYRPGGKSHEYAFALLRVYTGRVLRANNSLISKPAMVFPEPGSSASIYRSG